MESHDEESPLVVGDSPTQKLMNHARDVHILSSAFLLIFLAYGAAQNLETTLNTVNSLFWIICSVSVACFRRVNLCKCEFCFRRKIWVQYLWVYCIYLSHFSLWSPHRWFGYWVQRMLWFLGLLDIGCS